MEQIYFTHLKRSAALAATLNTGIAAALNGGHQKVWQNVAEPDAYSLGLKRVRLSLRKLSLPTGLRSEPGDFLQAKYPEIHVAPLSSSKLLFIRR